MGFETSGRPGIIRAPWWGLSTGNILGRAIALFPHLHYARLDELGHDSHYELRLDLAAVRHAPVHPPTKVGGTRDNADP